MAFGGLLTRFKNQYDKLLAIIVLLGLLGSLLFLALRIGFMKNTTEKIRIRIDGVRPKHEKATVVDTLEYEQAERTIRNPFQLPVWTNSLLFVPETRVWCYGRIGQAQCRQPMAFDATNCPFCLFVPPPPPPPPEDMDKDGIKDVWETKYGLDPTDPSDASFDPDGDKFTNREEFIEDTDPTDKDDSPDIVVKLRVRAVQESRMSLRFEGKSKLSETKFKYQVNLRIGNRQRTFIRYLKEPIGNTGFVIDRFEEKWAQVQDETGTRKREVSILYLTNGEQPIPLVIKQDTPWREYRAILYLEWGEQPEYRVQMDTVFEPEGEKYTVIGIDSEKQTVVIKRASDGKQFTIAKSPAGEEGAGE